MPDQPFLDFDGEPFSLSLWAKGPAAQSESGGLACKGLGGGDEAFCLDIWGAAFRFFVRNSAGQVPAGGSVEPGVPPNGQWQHLAVAYDPAQGQSRFFINGALAGTGLTADSVLSNTDPLDIGARQFQGGYTLPWTGLLDDIRLYNRAITSIEIRALTYQGYPPSLSLSWRGGQVTLNWAFEAVSYELQTSASLGGTWSTVPGVATNSATLPAAGAASFYRLHRKVLY